MFKLINKCRVCSGKNLKTIIDLGKQPPANSLQKSINRNQKAVPLKVIRCSNCCTLQLNSTVNPKNLFSNYVWVTGTSDEVKNYRDIFIKKIIKRNRKKTSILEIASNDGFFLKEFQKKNYTILGIDPAKNIANKANKLGVQTIPDFFNHESAKYIKKKYFSPDIVICRNVIPHVENINSVIKGIANVLNANGKAYIEFHYAENLSKNLHYDYIYHEHVFYYTLYSITKLLNLHKLYPVDYFKSPISGGSIVLEISKNSKLKSKNLVKLQNYEKKTQINSYKYWKNFKSKCIQHREKLNKIISKYKNIYGYGASARSSTLLNYCKITNKNIKAIFDKNPIKHNLFTAGSNIKILNPSIAEIKKTETILILAWNFEKEIIHFLKKKMKFKGNLIVVLPKIKVIKCK